MIHQKKKKSSVSDNLIAHTLSARLCCPGRCCQQSMCEYRWTLDSWPVLHMHPAWPCSASCRGLTSESRGHYSDSDRVLHSLSQFPLQTVHQWPWPLHWELTGSWDLQDPVLTGGSFITAEQGDCGKSSFSMKHNCSRVQDEGELASAANCMYNIIWVTRRWRSRESRENRNVTGHYSEKCLLLLKVPLPKKNWRLKHWSLTFIVDGTDEEGGISSENLWGQSKSHHCIFMSDCGACLLGLFPSVNGAHNRLLNSSSKGLQARCFLTEMCILSKLLGT